MKRALAQHLGAALGAFRFPTGDARVVGCSLAALRTNTLSARTQTLVLPCLINHTQFLLFIKRTVPARGRNPFAGPTVPATCPKIIAQVLGIFKRHLPRWRTVRWCYGTHLQIFSTRAPGLSPPPSKAVSFEQLFVLLCAHGEKQETGPPWAFR